MAGELYQSVAELAGHTNRLVITAVPIGATSVNATITTTVAGTDIYAEGMVHSNDVTGEGYAYRISRAFAADTANASASSVGVLTVNLDAGENVQVALDTTSQVTFTRNRYHQTTIHLSPATAQLTGVSPGVAAADRFYWSQVRGFTAIHADLTMLAGMRVMPSIAQNGQVESFKRRIQISTTGSVLTAATVLRGLVHDSDGANTALIFAVSVSTVDTFDITGGVANNGPDIGVCVKSNASTEFALVDLMIA